ncbi:Autotransporter beta-domain protein [compost metagenome]
MSLATSRIPTQGAVHRLSAIALGMAMTLHGTTASADPAGRLIFLGWTADQQHSVWLSAISPGQFEVESAKQSQIYDSWRQDHKGLHLTVSPEAQNGGTHKLYAYVDSNGKRVLLDTDNQQPGHFTFPDHFTPPDRPSRPTSPPQGLMPTQPGGVQPPAGTLPPQGVMPTLPGGVRPPVGTLPPQGVMPTLPGGVQSPAGTLPPQGVMPTRPPLGERPFITLPGTVEPPVALPGRVTAGQQASERALNERTLCVMAEERDQLPQELRDRYPDCPFTRVELAGGQVASQTQPAPLPEGRSWNLWVDEVYYDISDHREGLDMSGSTNVFSLGADTRLDNDLILGISVARVDSKVDSFNGGMRLSAGGYNLSPYLAYPVSASWMLDGSLVYGWMDNNQDLLFLSGDYGSTSVGGSLGATGQYFWEATSVRPRLAINYSHSRSDGYRMEGDYQGLALRLNRDSDSYNQGNMTGTVEFSRVYYTSKGLPLMPYGELGLDYGFERPNDGYILTGDLSSARTEPLSGTVRLGMRTLIGGEATLTTSAGYTSIGQNGLNIWEWRINLSKPF